MNRSEHLRHSLCHDPRGLECSRVMGVTRWILGVVAIVICYRLTFGILRHIFKCRGLLGRLNSLWVTPPIGHGVVVALSAGEISIFAR